MHKDGIGVGVSYPAMHLATLYPRQGLRRGRFPVSERIARETVTLPLFPEMHESDVERVCAAMAARAAPEGGVTLAIRHRTACRW